MHIHMHIHTHLFYALTAILVSSIFWQCSNNNTGIGVVIIQQHRQAHHFVSFHMFYCVGSCFGDHCVLI